MFKHQLVTNVLTPFVRKHKAAIILVLLVVASMPQVQVITVSADYTGDGTQIKAFIDVEANVSDDDSSDWRIARSTISIFDMANFRIKLATQTNGVEQDFGRVDTNDIHEDDLVDLPSATVDKDFSDVEDSHDYNHTISGLNSTATAVHVILFDVSSVNTGLDSTVSAGMSNSTSGVVYASTTFFNETLRSTQVSIYIRFDAYALDGSNAQYYVRSVNTTNLEYSSLRVYSGNDIFLQSNSFDQDLGGIEFDASAALNGNVTGTSEKSRIARATLRVPDRLFGNTKVGYSELGGFTDFDDTLKAALKVASSEEYNLTQLDLRLILPGALTKQVKQRWDELVDNQGDNEQGWQFALNSIRSEWIRTLGIGRFSDVPFDGKNLWDDIKNRFKGSNTLSSIKENTEDFVDLAKSTSVAAALTGSAEKESDITTTTDLISYWKDNYNTAGNWLTSKTHADDVVGWIKSTYENGKTTYEGYKGVAGFFNNVNEFLSDNQLTIIVILVLITLLAAVWLMRRRSVRSGNAEVSL